MGNNHDKYFGSDKRKIIILGLQKAGKTTLLQYISTEQVNYKTQKTKNLNIQDVKIGNLQVTFFDLAGGERQRVFWKQQYEGTQGILYIIDITCTAEQKQKNMDELDKLIKHFGNSVPIAVGLAKTDQMQIFEWGKYKSDLSKQIGEKLRENQIVKVFEIDYKNKDSIKNLLGWILQKTKPI